MKCPNSNCRTRMKILPNTLKYHDDNVAEITFVCDRCLIFIDEPLKRHMGLKK